MIGTLEAQDIIEANTKALAACMLPLEQCSGRVLASDIYAGTDFPAFPQAAMDGYAFCFGNWRKGAKLNVVAAVAAGDAPLPVEGSRVAVRIFTGAALPAGVDTVVMQEKVHREGDYIMINDEEIVAGSNVRRPGSEIRAGSLALHAGTQLSPAALGFLAGIGIAEVSVIPAPRVRIIITGNELCAPGEPLAYGQVFESNSIALCAALRQMQIEDVQVFKVADDPEKVQSVLSLALGDADMVLLTGGVSVGDYDFVLQAAASCGIQTRFHKIRQKPGKPLFFGTRQQQLIFGLPGNPASVLTCFYIYVKKALHLLGGMAPPVSQSAALAEDYHKKGNLSHFLKARYDGNSVYILPAQESYRMQSFAIANCLAELAGEEETVKKGRLIRIHPIA
jgi:molybdopterin molybdotransferase